MKTIGLVVLAAALAFGPAAEARKSHSGFHVRAVHMPKARTHVAGPRSVRIRHANGQVETCRRDAGVNIDLICR